MPSPTGRSTDKPALHWLRRCTAALTATTAGAVLVLGSPLTEATRSPEPVAATAQDGLSLVAADPQRWPGHPGRRLVRYTVRRGDTATGLAVRFHAWTRELRSLNHLGRHGTLYVGQRIRIPVVVAAARKTQHHAKPRPTVGKRTRHHASRHPNRPHRVTHPWKLADVSQAKVRRVVVKVARARGVDPHLALAVAWQESGWQQRRISSAGAIGVMQVLPGTSRWMAQRIGRPLNPYGLYDNVTAGVSLIKVLRSQARPKIAVASYFQGLGSVQERGMYTSTKAYVHNVTSLRSRMERGWNPV
ncbi:MAG: transglycosylase SLT domain-containing protein [Nocardioidaceae bacterium]